MMNDIERTTLERMDFECVRLEDFAKSARNQCAFEVMEDIRDAACMHVLWLYDLVMRLPVCSKSALGVTDLQKLSECAKDIKKGVDGPDWGAMFHFCASCSWSLQEQVRQLLSADDKERNNAET